MWRWGALVGFGGVAACTLLAPLDGLSDGEGVVMPDASETGSPGPVDSGVGPSLIVDGDAADPLAASLVAHWRLDETSGTTANDSSGRGNHGLVLGGAPWTPARLDGGLRTNGTSQYIEVAGLGNDAFPRSGTLSIWLKSDFVEDGNRPIFDGYGEGRDHFFVRRTTAGTQIQIGGQRRDAGSAFLTSFTVTANAWVHIVVTWDTTARKVAFYLDDALVTTKDLPEGWTPRDQRTSFARQDCCGGFIGLLDELRLYDRALTAAEVQTLP